VPITARFLAEVALLISGNDLELAENSGREPVVPFGPLFVNTCDSLAPLRCHEAIGEFDVAIDRMREAALALKVALPQPDPELSQLLALTARMVRNRPEQ